VLKKLQAWPVQDVKVITAHDSLQGRLLLACLQAGYGSYLSVVMRMAIGMAYML
jgi:hypothetical protein